MVRGYGHLPEVWVLGTGGTIAGRSQHANDHVTYQAGQVAVSALLHGLPVPLGCQVYAEQVAQIDSKDMGQTVWLALLTRTAALLAQPQVQGIVITHGTDTLEETAYLLHRVLRPHKPVVLTCAMRPATAVGADGPQNLVDALNVATTGGATGVLVVCAGQIHAGAQVRKVHHYRLDPFSSGDAGPMGVIEQGRCVMFQPWPAAEPHVQWGAAALGTLLTQPWPRVECLFSHGGADAWLVRALLAHNQKEQTQAGADVVRGLVIAGTGNATVHQDLALALLEAQHAGVTVCRTTRCVSGRVVIAFDHGDESGIPVIALPVPQARLALMLDLLGIAP